MWITIPGASTSASLELQVSNSLTSMEQFTISFAEDGPNTLVMILAWDNVVVPVKMNH